jgi:hypothetical protein
MRKGGFHAEKVALAGNEPRPSILLPLAITTEASVSKFGLKLAERPVTQAFVFVVPRRKTDLEPEQALCHFQCVLRVLSLGSGTRQTSRGSQWPCSAKHKARDSEASRRWCTALRIAGWSSAIPNTRKRNVSKTEPLSVLRFFHC